MHRNHILWTHLFSISQILNAILNLIKQLSVKCVTKCELWEFNTREKFMIVLVSQMLIGHFISTNTTIFNVSKENWKLIVLKSVWNRTILFLVFSGQTLFSIEKYSLAIRRHFIYKRWQFMGINPVLNCCSHV